MGLKRRTTSSELASRCRLVLRASTREPRVLDPLEEWRARGIGRPTLRSRQHLELGEPEQRPVEDVIADCLEQADDGSRLKALVEAVPGFRTDRDWRKLRAQINRARHDPRSSDAKANKYAQH
jgi:hypothetical protein